jgi:TatD DNase family protein
VADSYLIDTHAHLLALVIPDPIGNPEAFASLGFQPPYQVRGKLRWNDNSKRSAAREARLAIHLIDTHAHLDIKDFDSDRDEVIARAVAAGVGTIVTVGTDVDASLKAITLAKRYPQVYAAVGIHPHESDRATDADIARLEELAKQPRVVAIGETGLDFYRNYSSREGQHRVLRAQLELAARLGLPVIIHARQAEAEIMGVLTEWAQRHPYGERKPRGVIHCFSGNENAAKKYIELGFYISFPGTVSYPNSRGPQVAKTLPRDRILVETDCPFLTHQKHRGTRNEPAYVRLTAETLAEALGMPLEEFARQTTDNARALFKFQ